MSRRRIRTLYVVGIVLGWIGLALAGVGGWMFLSSSGALVRELGGLTLLLGIGQMMVGGICWIIAHGSASRRFVREAGRTPGWGGWELVWYILGEGEPRRRSKS